METTYDPAQLRAFVALQTLGLCTALEEGALSGDGARRWLFSTDMVTKLERIGACVGCMHLVELGATLAELVESGDATCPVRIAKLKQQALAVLVVP